MTRFIAASIVAALLSVGAADAQDTRPAATTRAAEKVAPATAGIEAVVVAISGRAQRSVAAEGKTRWTALKVGDKLGERTVVRTGLGAKVVLRFADRGEVTVNNGTKFGIGELRKEGKKLKARLGLKYGTVRASVDSSRGPNDWTVSTPTATLSVRGSTSDIGWQGDIGLRIRSYAGRWHIATMLRSRGVRPGAATDDKLTQFYILRSLYRELLLTDVFGVKGAAERNFLKTNSGGRGLALLNTGTSGGGGGSTGGSTIPQGSDGGGNDRDQGSP